MSDERIVKTVLKIWRANLCYDWSIMKKTAVNTKWKNKTDIGDVKLISVRKLIYAE